MRLSCCIKKIDGSSNLISKGLHVYDGHIRDSDFNLRKEKLR